MRKPEEFIIKELKDILEILKKPIFKFID